jgi:polyisoprenyl-teichoic acid--peptidoglycan teichoic acid transferase
MAKNETSFWSRFFYGLLYSLYLILFLAGGTVLGWAGQSETMLSLVRGTVLNTDPADAFATNGVRPEVVNLLILGCDNDVYVENGAKKTRKGRSDMIMVVQLNFDKKTIRGISIPRDVWVSGMPGVRNTKVNALYVVGGPELTAAYAENLLGIKIDRVIDLDFVAFQDLVDMAGGVDVFVEKRMEYHDNWADLHIDLRPGQQHLDGYEAMGYVRFRHTDSDFERQKRQKAFMIAVKNAIMSRWYDIPDLMNQGVRMTGGGLNSDEIAALMRFSRMVEEADIRLEMVPVYDLFGSNLGVKDNELEALLTSMGFVRTARRGSGYTQDFESMIDRNREEEVSREEPERGREPEPIQEPEPEPPTEEAPAETMPDEVPPLETEPPDNEPPAEEEPARRQKPEERAPRLPWDTPSGEPGSQGEEPRETLSSAA